MGTTTKLAGIVALLALVASADAEARVVKRHHVRGKNELSGGIGFAADLTPLTPGGFKWFNEYGHHLGGPTWLNLQFNVTAGDGGRGCYWYRDDVWICDEGDHFDGHALELGLGVKLKWRARRSPVQVHTKIGAAVDMIWFDVYYGTAAAFRSGFGVRYFIVPSFSVGGEVMAAVGPHFSRYGDGVDLYAAVDLNLGVEARF